MAGTLNAIGLMAVMLGTVLVLWRYGKWPPTFWQVITGIVIAFLAICFTSIFTTHACDAGNPATQLLIPGLCILIAYPSLAHKKARSVTTATLIVAMLVLGFEFTEIVHTSDYTGNTQGRMNNAFTQRREHAITEMRTAFNEVFVTHPAYGNKVFHAGALQRPEIITLLPQEERENLKSAFSSFSLVYTPLWHSGLTGLFGKHTRSMILWYPGGRLSDGIAHIAYRYED